MLREYKLLTLADELIPAVNSLAPTELASGPTASTGQQLAVLKISSCGTVFDRLAVHRIKYKLS